MLLTGEKGFITGAGAGIGRAIALEMVRQGADLYITDLDPDAAEAVAAEARRVAGPRVAAAALDVRDAAMVTERVREAAETLGGLTVAVNNAGVSSMRRVVDLTESDWDFNMDINAKGVFLCSQAEVRAMLDGGSGGSIVNTASMAGKKAAPLLAHYSASKFAVIGFTQALALEVAEEKIRVNSVCPGYVRTSMQEREVTWEAALRGMAPEQVRDEYLRAIPLGRLEEPEDVANVVVFLLSDLAGYMTGQAINVTGGSIMF
jgi:meso-butanediol dehydrogenase / (S,S)-butanediol dehydrogenase / diacetyl reductase